MENPRVTIYPVTNSFYHLDNACKLKDPPTEIVTIEIENKDSVVEETSFLEEILKLYGE